MMSKWGNHVDFILANMYKRQNCTYLVKMNHCMLIIVTVMVPAIYLKVKDG